MLKHLAYSGIASLFLLAANSSCLAQNSAADIYQSKCQMCHAADGSCNTPAGKAMKAHPFNLARCTEAVGRRPDCRHQEGQEQDACI
jgi:hypothetical protein